uniref:ID204 n=1 Tax=Bradyrhizobium japonicum TaxID=375 RepID=Q9ANI1_BRAJP|nr:ID204 [Bradyrhizobium japonicum]
MRVMCSCGYGDGAREDLHRLPVLARELVVRSDELIRRSHADLKRRILGDYARNAHSFTDVVYATGVN